MFIQPTISFACFVAATTESLRLVRALCLTVSLWTAADLASAAVIYSNLGPNDTFVVSPGTYPVWNLNSGGYIHRAASFVVPGTQNVQFGSADLGFYLQSGQNFARVELAANAIGNIPGGVIEGINIQLPAPSANPTIVTATSQTNPTLVAGATYWIIASMRFPQAMATWSPNNQGASGGNATRTNFMNGQWFLQAPSGMPSLRINAMIPEPGAALTAILAAATLACIRRRPALSRARTSLT